ncbi:MAG: Clp protease N-terminal domain-containing protein, partial [Isosphaeraceae bacterium]
MYDASYTPGAQRALDRAQVRARARGGSSVEPVDLLAALVDEAESRAAELMAQFGLDPARVLNALGMESAQSSLGPSLETLTARPLESTDMIMPLPHSAAVRAVLLDASMLAKALDRGLHVRTEHLLAGLMAESSSAAQRLLADGLELEGLRSHLSEQLLA